MGDGLVLEREVHARVEPQDLLGRRDLGSSQGRAVCLAGVLLVRRRPSDDRRQGDDRRRIGIIARGDHGPVQRLDVLLVPARRAPAHPLRVPAVSGVPGEDVLRLGDVGVVLDRDIVVVVDQHQTSELVVACQRRDLVTDAFFDVAVRGEDVDMVVERALPGRGIRVEQPALAPGCHSHADRVSQALAERSRRGLYPRGQPMLGVAGRAAAPGTQFLEIIEREPVTGQIKLNVKSQARMPA